MREPLLTAVPDRVLARLLEGGPLSPHYPDPSLWRSVVHFDRFDRALEEQEIAPLVVRFVGSASAGEGADLDRLRLELESTLLRIPVLRARPLARIELALPMAWLDLDIGGLVRATRHQIPRGGGVPVVAEIARGASLAALERLRAAGCAYLRFRGVPARELGPLLPALRRAGFAAIAADLACDELGWEDGKLLAHAAGAAHPSGLDALCLRSPAEGGELLAERIRQRIGGGLIALGALRAAGYRSVAPRCFSRIASFPGLTPFAEEHTALGCGPGAIRQAGALSCQNTPERDPWAESIDHGLVPPGTSHRAGEEEMLRRRVIRALLGDGRLDVVTLERDCGIDFIHKFEPEVAALEERQHDGLVECDFDRIEATPIGRLLIEDVAGCFDPARLARERARSWTGE